MGDDTNKERIWMTYEWGRVWVGCDHGREFPEAFPVRICQACFDKVIHCPTCCVPTDPLHGRYVLVRIRGTATQRRAT